LIALRLELPVALTLRLVARGALRRVALGPRGLACRDRRGRARVGRSDAHRRGSQRPGRKFAEMDRSGFLHRGQVGHSRQIGFDVAGEIGWHRRIDRRARLLVLPVHREDQGLRTPRGAILARQQRVKDRQRRLAVSRNAQRQRVIARQRRIAGPDRERAAIVALRRHAIAAQLVRQRPIAKKDRLARAQAFGLAEIAQRLVVLADRQHRRAERRLDARLARKRTFGARQETERRLRIVEHDRRLARVEQRIAVVPVLRDPRQRPGQLLLRIGALLERGALLRRRDVRRLRQRSRGDAERQRRQDDGGQAEQGTENRGHPISL
jgi:hypothetical protein